MRSPERMRASMGILVAVCAILSCTRPSPCAPANAEVSRIDVRGNRVLITVETKLPSAQTLTALNAAKQCLRRAMDRQAQKIGKDPMDVREDLDAFWTQIIGNVAPATEQQGDSNYRVVFYADLSEWNKRFPGWKAEHLLPEAKPTTASQGVVRPTPPGPQHGPQPFPTPRADTPQFKGQGWAVVVGISEYERAGSAGLNNLIFADDDAVAFAKSLERLGWDADHIRLLTNKQATMRDVTIALESWLTRARPEDLVVLYWSGHGFPDPADPEKVYFVCYDTDAAIPATGFRMDRVRTVLEERQARNVVVLADTCHAGKLITRGGERAIGVQPYVEKLRREQAVPKGWIFMVSAATDRKAIEHSSWRNGAFTHCLLEALSGKADGFESVGPKDGIIAMSELRAYLSTVMPQETQRVFGVGIHPVITTSTGDPAIWNLTLSVR